MSRQGVMEGKSWGALLVPKFLSWDKLEFSNHRQWDYSRFWSRDGGFGEWYSSQRKGVRKVMPATKEGTYLSKCACGVGWYPRGAGSIVPPHSV